MTDGPRTHPIRAIDPKTHFGSFVTEARDGATFCRAPPSPVSQLQSRTATSCISTQGSEVQVLLCQDLHLTRERSKSGPLESVGLISKGPKKPHKDRLVRLVRATRCRGWTGSWRTAKQKFGRGR